MTEQKNTSTESLQRIEFGHQSVQERIKHFGDFTINTAEGAKLYPIGENYSIDGGTVYADLSALYPQGSNWRFTEVVRAVYTARDAEGVQDEARRTKNAA